jgi:hypothetical protein
VRAVFVAASREGDGADPEPSPFGAKQTLKQVACKKLPRRRVSGDRLLVIQREIDMLKSASHVSWRHCSVTCGGS